MWCNQCMCVCVSVSTQCIYVKRTPLNVFLWIVFSKCVSMFVSCVVKLLKRDKRHQIVTRVYTAYRTLHFVVVVCVVVIVADEMLLLILFCVCDFVHHMYLHYIDMDEWVYELHTFASTIFCFLILFFLFLCSVLRLYCKKGKKR